MKKLNSFEIKGLFAYLAQCAGWNNSYDQICGKCDNNMVNLQNHYPGYECNVPSLKYPHLGAVGLTLGEDVVCQFWDEDGENDVYYRISLSDLRHEGILRMKLYDISN